MIEMWDAAIPVDSCAQNPTAQTHLDTGVSRRTNNVHFDRFPSLLSSRRRANVGDGLRSR